MVAPFAIVAAVYGSALRSGFVWDDAPALRNAGRFYLMEGQPDLAERAFRRALELDPDSASARKGLEAALAMRQTGRGNK